MTDMIERVARAILAANGSYLASDEMWPKALVGYREICVYHPAYADSGGALPNAFRTARAAIEAMREPADVMVEQGVEAIEDVPSYANDTIARTQWQAMIGAALAAPPRDLDSLLSGVSDANRHPGT